MKNTEETKVRLSEQISGYMIDEISSESSAGGRRFLRNPEKRIHKNVGLKDILGACNFQTKDNGARAE
ncbi:hypothetical protein Smp_135990 [Schistosoma mansoni]|uniref:hypothetical protein n=1 Tax=Schistosoma mansoni TaxID=6183 RepID=UPI0001A63895|nr:hypothetical protein Smp_135990 [Schistosoma mansoni]|eukprot:XP_018654946.1 hypothetical protein Smp_135990 [Schistosoma mansoni]